MRLSMPRKFISEQIRGTMRATEKRLLADTRRMAQETLAFAAKRSPQWTGTYAANWRLSINRERPGNNVDEVARENERERPQASEGDLVAVRTAINSPGSKLSGLKLGDRIYLSTLARNADDGLQYHWRVERGQIQFRPQNPTARANGGRILELARLHLKANNAGKLR